MTAGTPPALSRRSSLLLIAALLGSPVASLAGPFTTKGTQPGLTRGRTALDGEARVALVLGAVRGEMSEAEVAPNSPRYVGLS